MQNIYSNKFSSHGVSTYTLAHKIFIYSLQEQFYTVLVSESDYTSYRRRKSSLDIRVIATLILLLVIILTGLCVFSVIALRLYYTHHDTITSTSNRTAEYGYLSDGKTQVGLGNSPCSNFKVQVWLCLWHRLML